MKADGGGAATGDVAAAIEKEFGNFNNFKVHEHIFLFQSYSYFNLTPLGTIH